MKTREQILRRSDTLAEQGLIAAGQRESVARVMERYAVAITPAMEQLIATPDDPIARQFVPDAAELKSMPGELTDPIGDDAHSPVEGIVHRYPDRVLLKITPLCAAYCRFCFRREMVGPQSGAMLSPDALEGALHYIEANTNIWEVILTGGDPLILSARRLKAVMQRLAAIPHVAIVRFHTRVPVVDPARVTRALVRALKMKDKATYVVLHANHARELTPDARNACARLIDAGIPMLSQSVLLRGVNDNVEALGDLMRAFVAARIKPYYLHHADLAPGTSHLRCTIAEGQALMRALRGRLSGLCQPEFMLDIPGGHGKSPIGPDYLARHGDGTYRVTDFNGAVHCYPPPT
ncbi:MAG: lysine-2,3-aminomutase-like protein [Pseudorhodoplanes sp.]